MGTSRFQGIDPVRQSQILDTIKHHMLVAGYRAASTNAIAADAGISKGSLFAYFVTKEKMLEDVLRREFEPVCHHFVSARLLHEIDAVPALWATTMLNLIDAVIATNPDFPAVAAMCNEFFADDELQADFAAREVDMTALLSLKSSYAAFIEDHVAHAVRCGLRLPGSAAVPQEHLLFVDLLMAYAAPKRDRRRLRKTTENMLVAGLTGLYR
jgi:AcrR family transcriptional regulator